MTNDEFGFRHLSLGISDTSLVQPARFTMIAMKPVLLPPINGGSGSGSLTLAEVEAAAVAYHPAMREAEGRVRAARGAWLQAGLPPNPVIGYAGEEIGDAGTAGKQGGFVNQEFVTAGKLRLSRAVARREIWAAQQQREQVRMQVITTVRIYFFEAVAAQREAALARQLEAMDSRAVRASELRLQAMEGSRASLLQSQVEFETARLLVEQTAGRQEAAWQRLASVIGERAAGGGERGEFPTPRLSLPAPRSFEDTLAKPLPTLDWESSRRRLLRESPELAELHFRVERAKWAVDRARAGRVPNVNLQTGVEFDHVSGDTLANVQVSIPLPLFDRNQGNVARACGELTAAQAALEDRELDLEQRLAMALRDYQTASRRARRFAATILPAARESRDLVSRAYEQGELDYLQLLSTQRTYTEKSITHLQDLENAWKKWAEIDGLLVGPLRE